MTKREFLRHGREQVEKPLHYKMCGLDDIYLLSGFKRKQTPNGDGVAISDIDGLHKAIGLSLICDRKTLTANELRFLRKELKLTQAELGRHLRLSGQQVARWEKGECEISGPAEVLLRLRYALELVPPRKRAEFMNKLMAKLDELSKDDETETHKLMFRETESGWIKSMVGQTGHPRELAYA